MFHKSVMGRGVGWTDADKTLADYIRRKNKDMAFTAVVAESAPKKLTFDEWLLQQQTASNYEDPWQDSIQAAKDAWKAAQENCR